MELVRIEEKSKEVHNIFSLFRDYLPKKVTKILTFHTLKKELSDQIVASMGSMALESRSISLDDIESAKPSKKGKEKDQRVESGKGKGKRGGATEKEREKGDEAQFSFERVYGKQQQPQKGKKRDSMEVDENKGEGDEGDKAASSRVNQTKQYHSEIFDGPSHVIAAPANIYMSFMENLVQKASSVEAHQHPSEAELKVPPPS